MATQVWFGYSGLVWLLRFGLAAQVGLASQVWFGYLGLVWLLRLGLSTQAWFGYSGLVLLLRFGLATQAWFGYSGLVWLLRLGGSDTDRLRMVLMFRTKDLFGAFLDGGALKFFWFLSIQFAFLYRFTSNSILSEPEKRQKQKSL